MSRLTRSVSLATKTTAGLIIVRSFVIVSALAQSIWRAA